MAAVTRSELMLLLSERIPGISAKTADEAVRLILEEMTRAVSSGRRIEIRGFGSFALNYRPARKGRNPRSGESVEVQVLQVERSRIGLTLAIRYCPLLRSVTYC